MYSIYIYIYICIIYESIIYFFALISSVNLLTTAVNKSYENIEHVLHPRCAFLNLVVFEIISQKSRYWQKLVLYVHVWYLFRIHDEVFTVPINMNICLQL
jgi:hypothetical protein